MDEGFVAGRRSPRWKYDKGPDGRGRIRIRHTTKPCPGVALRFSTVIDCTPGQERMPPVTIDIIVKKNPTPPADEGGSPPKQVSAPARFTCSSDHFILVNQLRRVEAMVEEAGLPRACARSVEKFCALSASSATNMFYTSVAIKVEASIVGEVVDEEDGAATTEDECSICYMPYVVGGATSVKKLPCGHVYHRNCIDTWTKVNATCPYCRAPVPKDDDCFCGCQSEDDEEEDDDEHYLSFT